MNKTMKWIEAGKILSENEKENVKCPECENSDLNILDVRSESDEDMVERKIYCTFCGAKNYIRLKRPTGK